MTEKIIKLLAMGDAAYSANDGAGCDDAIKAFKRKIKSSKVLKYEVMQHLAKGLYEADGYFWRSEVDQQYKRVVLTATKAALILGARWCQADMVPAGAYCTVMAHHAPKQGKPTVYFATASVVNKATDSMTLKIRRAVKANEAKQLTMI